MNIKRHVWIFLSLLILPITAFGVLEEEFVIYNSPQAHSTGFATTLLGTGVLATFYNPALLAKTTRKKIEISFIDINTVFGFSGLGQIIGSRSISTLQMSKYLQSSADTYSFYQFNGAASASGRFLGTAPLINYRYAGISDGNQLNVDAVYDLVIPVSVATHIMGNRLKIGAVGKAIFRNELKGTYDHSQIQTEDHIKNLSKEGMGLGFDVGAVYTFPRRWLPTIGVVWQNVAGTHFMSSSNFLIGGQAGLPDSIPQGIHIAGSLSPNLGKRFIGTFMVEYKNLENFSLPFHKKFRFGIQLEDQKSFYLWTGLNKLYLCFGFALRLPGGNLELSTYSEEVGTELVPREDRRFALRYTIGF